jgi:uncharacterized protein (DUF1499 family)
MAIVLYVVLGLAVALVGSVGVILFTHVEDWSRDLVTNHAATHDDSRDERLRTIQSAATPAFVADEVVASAASLPRWELVQRDDESGTIRLQFVRTTGLVGYKDDIRVLIEPAGTGSRLSAESRSRVGKGDLGQNPRNLRELLAAIRARLK